MKRKITREEFQKVIDWCKKINRADEEYHNYETLAVGFARLLYGVFNGGLNEHSEDMVEYLSPLARVWYLALMLDCENFELPDAETAPEIHNYLTIA